MKTFTKWFGNNSQDIGGEDHTHAKRALAKAIKEKNADEVKILLAAHADMLEEAPAQLAAPRIHAQTGYKHFTSWYLCTPLQFAAIHDNEGKATTLLLTCGADVNNRGSLQASPLHIACTTKNRVFLKTVARLRTSILMHIDLSLTDALGRTCEMITNDEEIQQLISEFSEINQNAWQVVEVVERMESNEGEHAFGCRCVLCSPSSSSALSHLDDSSDDINSQKRSSNIPARSRVSSWSGRSERLSFFGNDLIKVSTHRKDGSVSRSHSGAISAEVDKVVTYGLIEFEDLELGDTPISGGSFADVFKASWKGKTVAVKELRHITLNGEDPNSNGVSDRFLQEVRMFEDLKHLNIIGFLGASLQGGKLYFCTEFATKGSLYKFLSQRELTYDIRTVKQWGTEIAHGMEYLACRNILHRDLKSPNILLTELNGLVNDGDPSNNPKNLICKICDFGLAHKVGNPQESTVGTVQWMAPEAIKKGDITLQSDVYSFGVVFWELATRQAPWRDFADVQVMWVVAELDERLAVPEQFPNCFKKILSSCWLTEPKDRPTWDILLYMLYSIDEFLLWSPPEKGRAKQSVNSNDIVVPPGTRNPDSIRDDDMPSIALSQSQQVWSRGIQEEMQSRIDSIPFFEEQEFASLLLKLQQGTSLSDSIYDGDSNQRSMGSRACNTTTRNRGDVNHDHDYEHDHDAHNINDNDDDDDDDDYDDHGNDNHNYSGYHDHTHDHDHDHDHDYTNHPNHEHEHGDDHDHDLDHSDCHPHDLNRDSHHHNDDSERNNDNNNETNNDNNNETNYDNNNETHNDNNNGNNNAINNHNNNNGNNNTDNTNDRHYRHRHHYRDQLHQHQHQHHDDKQQQHQHQHHDDQHQHQHQHQHDYQDDDCPDHHDHDNHHHDQHHHDQHHHDQHYHDQLSNTPPTHVIMITPPTHVILNTPPTHLIMNTPPTQSPKPLAQPLNPLEQNRTPDDERELELEPNDQRDERELELETNDERERETNDERELETMSTFASINFEGVGDVGDDDVFDGPANEK